MGTKLIQNTIEGIKELKKLLAGIITTKEKIAGEYETPVISEYEKINTYPANVGQDAFIKLQKNYEKNLAELRRNFQRRGIQTDVGGTYDMYQQKKNELDEQYRESLLSLRKAVESANIRQKAKLPQASEIRKRINYEERFKTAMEEYEGLPKDLSYINPNTVITNLRIWRGKYTDVFDDPASPYYEWGQGIDKKIKGMMV